MVSNAYGAQYGGLGGAQVNEITKSGTNRFHGNAAYWWNGRVMNANGYFNNQTVLRVRLITSTSTQHLSAAHLQEQDLLLW